MNCVQFEVFGFYPRYQVKKLVTHSWKKRGNEKFVRYVMANVGSVLNGISLSEKQDTVFAGRPCAEATARPVSQHLAPTLDAADAKGRSIRSFAAEFASPDPQIASGNESGEVSVAESVSDGSEASQGAEPEDKPERRLSNEKAPQLIGTEEHEARESGDTSSSALERKLRKEDLLGFDFEARDPLKQKVKAAITAAASPDTDYQSLNTVVDVSVGSGALTLGDDENLKERVPERQAAITTALGSWETLPASNAEATRAQPFTKPDGDLTPQVSQSSALVEPATENMAAQTSMTPEVDDLTSFNSKEFVVFAKTAPQKSVGAGLVQDANGFQQFSMATKTIQSTAGTAVSLEAAAQRSTRSVNSVHSDSVLQWSHMRPHRTGSAWVARSSRTDESQAGRIGTLLTETGVGFAPSSADPARIGTTVSEPEPVLAEPSLRKLDNTRDSAPSDHALRTPSDPRLPHSAESVSQSRPTQNVAQLLVPELQLSPPVERDTGRPALDGADPLVRVDTDVARGPEQVVLRNAPAGNDFRQAELARQIAIQITQRPAAAGSIVEVQLSPEELGSVKYRISLNETGLNILIQADRPETQELLRRHMDQLQAQFASLGFDESTISFANYASDGDAAHQREDSSGDAIPDTTPVMATGQTSTHITALGVDLRV